MQLLRFNEAMALDVDARKAVEQVAGWIPESPALTARIDYGRSTYGNCRLADVLGGNGRTDIRVRMECEHGPMEAALQLDEQKKLKSLTITKPNDVSCVP